MSHQQHALRPLAQLKPPHPQQRPPPHIQTPLEPRRNRLQRPPRAATPPACFRAPAPPPPPPNPPRGTAATAPAPVPPPAPAPPPAPLPPPPASPPSRGY